MKRVARVGVLLLASVVVFSAEAGAGAVATRESSAGWRQVGVGVTNSSAALGLARTKDGVLHVLLTTPNTSSGTGIADVPVSPTGVMGAATSIISGWEVAEYPDAYVGADGAVHAFWSGSKTQFADPTRGLSTATGPGTWNVAPAAIATAGQIQEEQARVVEVSGSPLFVWFAGPTLYLGRGSDPTSTPEDITPPGADGIPSNAVIARDPATGAVAIGWEGLVGFGTPTSKFVGFYRMVSPSLEPTQQLPGAWADRGNTAPWDQAPALAARAVGGIYAAYSPNGRKVVLTRLGGSPRTVPVPAAAVAPSGGLIQTVGVFPGPDGRLWVAFGNTHSIWVTRSNKAVSGFEPRQALRWPAGAIRFGRLEGEGSVGSLDLFADVTVDGKAKDGSYLRQVEPELSMTATARPVKGSGGKVRSVAVKVHVTDAGDALPASVTGLPGGLKNTGAGGAVVATVPAGSGKLRLTATAPGYRAATTSVSP
jgi:hypothetical protein